jgi:hypothetical protein
VRKPTGYYKISVPKINFLIPKKIRVEMVKNRVESNTETKGRAAMLRRNNEKVYLTAKKIEPQRKTSFAALALPLHFILNDNLC